MILKIRQKLDFKALAKLQSAQKDVVNFTAANQPTDKGTVPEALVLGITIIGVRSNSMADSDDLCTFTQNPSNSDYSFTNSFRMPG